MGTKIKPHKAYTYWTDRDKERAILVYKSLGNLMKTSEITGIPYDTLQDWKHKEWWNEALLAAKQEDTVALEDATTQISKKATDVLRDRLEHGDHVLKKDGEVIRVPVSAKDAAVVLGISLSRRKELQEEPVRIAQLGTTERLLKLVQQFAKIATAKEIEGELVDDSKNEEGLSGEVRERSKEPVEAQLIEAPSGEEAPRN